MALTVAVVFMHIMTLVLDVHGARIVTAKTNGTAKFMLGNDFGVPISGQTSLSFDVKACGNVFLLLAEKIKVGPKSRRGNYYFISLGVTKTHRISGILEGCYTCNTFKNYKFKTVLSCDQFKSFWIRWDGQGSVKCGQGTDLNSEPLLKYTGTKRYPINFFHVTSFNSTAEFRFHLPCEEGTYGENCTSACGNCKCGNSCDPEYGTCHHGCQPGWTGQQCTQKCRNNTYGDNCTRCGRCRDDALCDVITGSCPQKSCQPGWVGDRCDRECPLGTYGPYCAPCGYCDNGITCDVTSGQCPEGCMPGWTGDRCDKKCMTRTHGDNCSTCGHCKHDDTCHMVTGHCPRGCDAGWLGHACKQKCKSHTYGENCSFKCGMCYEYSSCDHLTGYCGSGCQPGWYGARCNKKCPRFTYGTDCRYVCGHCVNGSNCDQVTGSCPDGCADGWTGATCDAVEAPSRMRKTTISTVETTHKTPSDVTTPEQEDRRKHKTISTASLRGDTIASITLGVVVALMIGVIIVILWRRAVAQHENKYRANFSCDTGRKVVKLDIPSQGAEQNEYDNPGFLANSFSQI